LEADEFLHQGPRPPAVGPCCPGLPIRELRSGSFGSAPQQGHCPADLHATARPAGTGDPRLLSGTAGGHPYAGSPRAFTRVPEKAPGARTTRACRVWESLMEGDSTALHPAPRELPSEQGPPRPLGSSAGEQLLSKDAAALHRSPRHSTAGSHSP